MTATGPALSRTALVAIALAFVVAEFVRPTHWEPKRISHATTVELGGVPLDETVLDGIPPIARLALGSIDVIRYQAGARTMPLNAGTAIPSDATITLIGWAGDPVARSAPAGAFVSVDGRERIDISADFTIPRPDVVKYYNAPGLLHSGFQATIPATALGEGTHELQFGVIARGGLGFYPLAGPIDLTVR